MGSLSVLQQHGSETESGHSELTDISVPAQALKLILSGGHAGATVSTRPAVTRADGDALTDGPALCESVGQIDLLPIDRNLEEKKQSKNSKSKAKMLKMFHIGEIILVENCWTEGIA